MGALLSLVNKGDPFVNAVLDEILAETLIDPSSVVPDYQLCQEFGITRVQLQTVLYRAAQALKIQVPFESCRLNDASARQLVDLLRHWDRSSGSNRQAA